MVTGSSSGIGKAVALAFAREGSKVVINYKTNKSGGEGTKAEIEELGRSCLLVQADITKVNDIDRLFKKTKETFGTVDILVNNAAIGTDKVPFMKSSYEDILEMVNTDLISAMLCSQRAVKAMEEKGQGKILNTSSIRGWEYGGRAIVYAAAKAGINSFTLAKNDAMTGQVIYVDGGFTLK